jgi:hypothetical protein
MLATLLLGSTLALASTSETTRVEIVAGGEGGYSRYDFTGSTRTATGASISGGAGWGTLRFFFDSIRDDDAAPPLQPFLQRAGRFSLSANGGAWSTDYGKGFLPASSSGGGAGVDTDGYFGPHRAIYAGIGFRVDYNTQHYGGNTDDTSMLTLPAYLTMGVRWRELRIRASWEIAPQRVGAQAFKVPFWGNVGLHFYGVVRRRLVLGADAYVLEGGASGAVDAELWLARRFGVYAGVHGGHRTWSTSDRAEDFAGGVAGFDCWLTARFAVFVSYRPDWRHYTGNGDPTSDGVEHLVTFGLVGRPL